MPKLIKAYMDFRGGLNVDAAPDNLADNELEQADNVDLDERGSVSKRKGAAPFNAVSYGAQVEKIIEWPSTKVILAVVGTTLAEIAKDGTKIDIKALDTANIGYFFFQDRFYFTGKEAAVDKYWAYDGATVVEVTPNAAADNDLAPIKRCRMFAWNPRSLRFFAALDPSDKTALYYSEPNDPTAMLLKFFTSGLSGRGRVRTRPRMQPGRSCP